VRMELYVLPRLLSQISLGYAPRCVYHAPCS
jgi:hypothetical protein